LSVNAINKETQSIDRKAHLFWEIPTIDAKINELMSTLSSSGKAAARLQMTGDSKDARNFFIIKKKEQERGITHELRADPRTALRFCLLCVRLGKILIS